MLLRIVERDRPGTARAAQAVVMRIHLDPRIGDLKRGGDGYIARRVLDVHAHGVPRLGVQIDGRVRIGVELRQIGVIIGIAERGFRQLQDVDGRASRVEEVRRHAEKLK